MNNYRTGYFFTISLIVLFLFSCKIQETETVKIKLKPKSSRFLIQQLRQNEFQFNTISAKASVEIIDSTGKKTEFKTHFRIKQDSIIWMSITSLLGIEMVRLNITKDSLKMINRLDKEYFVGNFDYINQLIGSELDYQMLEALLIGNSIEFDENEKIHSSIDKNKNSYYLSTVKKRKLRKEIKKNKNKIKENAQALWLNPFNFKIKEILFTFDELNNNLICSYDNFKEIATQKVPQTIEIRMQSSQIMRIHLKYTKFIIGKSLSFPFKIPSKYEPIKQ